MSLCISASSPCRVYVRYPYEPPPELPFFLDSKLFESIHTLVVFVAANGDLKTVDHRRTMQSDGRLAGASVVGALEGVSRQAMCYLEWIRHRRTPIEVDTRQYALRLTRVNTAETDSTRLPMRLRSSTNRESWRRRFPTLKNCVC